MPGAMDAPSISMFGLGGLRIHEDGDPDGDANGDENGDGASGNVDRVGG